jgi:ankyrin repeat protein
VVKLLLERGSTVDLVDALGWTALHWACQREDSDVARLLLEAGAAADIKDALEQTPLYIACSQGGSLSLVELLLQFTAAVDGRSGRLMLTPLMVSVMSEGRDRLAIAKLLISRGADIQLKSSEGWTALHMAARLGHLDVAEQLLDVGASVNCGCDRHNETPLFEVLKIASWMDSDEKSLHTFELLVARGADVNWRNRTGETPLHSACLRKLKIIPLLLRQGADLNAADENGETPLHFLQLAYGANYTAEEVDEAARMLLDGGADLDATSELGVTPFLGAVISRSRGMSQLLLDHQMDQLPDYE